MGLDWTVSGSEEQRNRKHESRSYRFSRCGQRRIIAHEYCIFGVDFERQMCVEA
jgi:hypothetical protein